MSEYHKRVNRRNWDLRLDPKVKAKKKTHEQCDADYARFLAGGGVVTQLPGFTYQPRPRASYSFGEGARSGG